MDHVFFIHSSVHGHLGCFHVLAIVNTAAMSTGVLVPFQIMVFCGCIPRSGIAGSYGISVFRLKPKISVLFSFVQFSSVQSLSRVRLFATPWMAAHQASLSITSSQSSLRLTSIESVMPSSHLILCRPLLLLPPIPPSMSLFQWVNSSHEVAENFLLSTASPALIICRFFDDGLLWYFEKLGLP